MHDPYSNKLVPPKALPIRWDKTTYINQIVLSFSAPTFSVNRLNKYSNQCC